MSERENTGKRHEGEQPEPSKAGKGPSVDVGRRQTQTEKDLRRVQSQYDPKHDRFDPNK